MGTRFTLKTLTGYLLKFSTPCPLPHSRTISTTTPRWRAKIIDGKALAKEIKDDVRAEVDRLVSSGGRPPHLTAVLVGEDPASRTYVKNKMAACKYTGFAPLAFGSVKNLYHKAVVYNSAGHGASNSLIYPVHNEPCYQQSGITSETIVLPETTSQEELLRRVEQLNRDERVDGLLVQLPVPPHIHERTVCNAVTPGKDVDGFHMVNVGRFCVDLMALIPATPAGVIEMLKRTGIETFGKNAVVCGRSKNVGMPIMMLLHSDGLGETEACDATVTMCHRYTPPEQLRVFTKTADIVVVATGIPGLITGDMLKPGVVVIDVGINRVQDEATGKFKVVGDVDFESVSKVASYITPVPGGVGPMTVAMLMKNTLTAHKKEVNYDFIK